MLQTPSLLEVCFCVWQVRVINWQSDVLNRAQRDKPPTNSRTKEQVSSTHFPLPLLDATLLCTRVPV